MARSISVAIAAVMLLTGYAYADSYIVHNRAETILLIRSAGVKVPHGGSQKNFELQPGNSRQVDLGAGYHMVQFVVYNKANMGQNYFYEDTNLNQPETKWVISVNPGIEVKMQMQ